LGKIPTGLDEELAFEFPADADFPKAHRRVLLTRPVKRRQAKRLRELLTWLNGVNGGAAGASEDLARQVFDVADQIAAVIASVSVGWRNVVDRDGRAVAFSADALDDVMDDGDVIGLGALLAYQGSLGSAEKKRSGSPSGLNTQSTAGSKPSTGSLVSGLSFDPSVSLAPGVMGDGRDGSG
jgi:hypothetical protein